MGVSSCCYLFKQRIYIGYRRFRLYRGPCFCAFHLLFCSSCRSSTTQIDVNCMGLIHLSHHHLFPPRCTCLLINFTTNRLCAPFHSNLPHLLLHVKKSILRTLTSTSMSNSLLLI